MDEPKVRDRRRQRASEGLPIFLEPHDDARRLVVVRRRFRAEDRWLQEINQHPLRRRSNQDSLRDQRAQCCNTLSDPGRQRRPLRLQPPSSPSARRSTPADSTLHKNSRSLSSKKNLKYEAVLTQRLPRIPQQLRVRLRPRAPRKRHDVLQHARLRVLQEEVDHVRDRLRVERCRARGGGEHAARERERVRALAFARGGEELLEEVVRCEVLACPELRERVRELGDLILAS